MVLWKVTLSNTRALKRRWRRRTVSAGETSSKSTEQQQVGAIGHSRAVQTNLKLLILYCEFTDACCLVRVSLPRFCMSLSDDSEHERLEELGGSRMASSTPHREARTKEAPIQPAIIFIPFCEIYHHRTTYTRRGGEAPKMTDDADDAPKEEDLGNNFTKSKRRTFSRTSQLCAILGTS